MGIARCVDTLVVLSLVPLCIGMSAVAGSADQRQPRLRVRVHVLATVDEGTFAGARTVADDLYRDAGVVIDWLVCGVRRDRTPARCRQTAAPGELWLRVLPETPAGPASDYALGYASLDPVTRRGVVANVYPARTARLAAAAGVSPSALLGIVVAHELGHLILRSPAHRRTGIMQRGWSVVDLRRRRLATLRFTAAEAAVLRHGVVSRTDDASHDRRHGPLTSGTRSTTP